MEPKKCPFLSGTTHNPCMMSECNLWVNNECVFLGIQKKMDILIPQIEEIKQRVKIL